MSWGVGDWFKYGEEEHKITGILSDGTIESHINGNTYTDRHSWSPYHLERVVTKIPGRSASSWNSYSTPKLKCECGCATVYGNDTEFHSHWCPVYKKP